MIIFHDCGSLNELQEAFQTKKRIWSTVPKYVSAKRQGREEEEWNYNIESSLGNASHVSDKLQLVEGDSNFLEEKKIKFIII